MEESEPSKSHRGFRRLVPYVARHRGRFLSGLALIPVFTGIQLYIPQIFGDALASLERLGDAIDGTDNGGVSRRFWIMTALVIAGLWVAHSGVRLLARYLQIGLSRVVEEELRNDFFRHLSRLPVHFFDQARIGDLVARSTQDIELVRFMAGPTVFFGVSTLIAGPGALILLAGISPVLVATVVGLFGLVALGLRVSFSKLAAQSRVVQDTQADIAAKAQEDFAGIRVVHAFAREDAEVEDFRRLADIGLAAHIDMSKSRALLHASFVAGGQVAPLALIVVGLAEGLAISDLFKAYLYMQLLVWPLMIIGWIAQTWHRARAAADRLDEVFDLAVEDAASSPHAPPSAVAAAAACELDIAGPPSIEARNLSFRYAEDAPLALHNVSFGIAGGKTLGLVGPIGSGKSTLIALLGRLYDPPPGALLVGGHDVRELPLAQLRDLFAVATQEPFLFSDSLRNNILFGGGTEATGGDVARAVSDAQLESDLAAFPERLDALVGERGVTLSGGQKQRASLARALLSKRGILVLDDTLSAVDHDTEQRILETLRTRADDQTKIVIAHRLDSVRHADWIVVLDAGKILEQGTHDDLTKRPGWYASTWRQQNRGRAS